jgi:hypothetical protein
VESGAASIKSKKDQRIAQLKQQFGHGGASRPIYVEIPRALQTGAEFAKAQRRRKQTLGTLRENSKIAAEVAKKHAANKSTGIEDHQDDNDDDTGSILDELFQQPPVMFSNFEAFQGLAFPEEDNLKRRKTIAEIFKIPRTIHNPCNALASDLHPRCDMPFIEKSLGQRQRERIKKSVASETRLRPSSGHRRGDEIPPPRAALTLARAAMQTSTPATTSDEDDDHSASLSVASVENLQSELETTPTGGGINLHIPSFGDLDDGDGAPPSTTARSSGSTGTSRGPHKTVVSEYFVETKTKRTAIIGTKDVKMGYHNGTLERYIRMRAARGPHLVHLERARRSTLSVGSASEMPPPQPEGSAQAEVVKICESSSESNTSRRSISHRNENAIESLGDQRLRRGEDDPAPSPIHRIDRPLIPVGDRDAVASMLPETDLGEIALATLADTGPLLRSLLTVGRHDDVMKLNYVVFTNRQIKDIDDDVVVFDELIKLHDVPGRSRDDVVFVPKNDRPTRCRLRSKTPPTDAFFKVASKDDSLMNAYRAVMVPPPPHHVSTSAVLEMKKVNEKLHRPRPWALTESRRNGLPQDAAARQGKGQSSPNVVPGPGSEPDTDFFRPQSAATKLSRPSSATTANWGSDPDRRYRKRAEALSQIVNATRPVVVAEDYALPLFPQRTKTRHQTVKK